MDNDYPTPPHRNASLPTFTRSLPVEIAVLPASTRTSFTRVDNNTRPGSVAGDDDARDETAPGCSDDGNGDGGGGGGGGTARALPPADEQPEGADAVVTVPQVPQTLLQFLLVTGRRRAMAFDPETTVRRVKELAWSTWPNDGQEERPPAPSFLRILYLGHILQDDDTLAQLKFPSYTPPEPATPTIVHLSIRSFVPREDTGLKKKRRLSRLDASLSRADTSQEHGGGCCCVIC
ncbi:hypothetical protein BC826DRAFT_1013428 [Russula brevipes]|nr:hypothetical protein BC826DRAFT_1013428 [Russula brevipes]